LTVAQRIRGDHAFACQFQHTARTQAEKLPRRDRVNKGSRSEWAVMFYLSSCIVMLRRHGLAGIVQPNDCRHESRFSAPRQQRHLMLLFSGLTIPPHFRIGHRYPSGLPFTQLVLSSSGVNQNLLLHRGHLWLVSLL